MMYYHVIRLRVYMGFLFGVGRYTTNKMHYLLLVHRLYKCPTFRFTEISRQMNFFVYRDVPDAWPRACEQAV